MAYIGNQTSCWAAPAEPFDYALAQGFDAFEWFPDKKPGAGWDESDLDKNARRAISESARARGMRLSVHARWQANPLAPDGYPLLWRDVELAHDLGAVLLNIHLFHDQGQAAFLEAILPLVRRTAELGLQLSIENTPHHSPEQFNEFFARLRALHSDEARHVGMCLDLGHANLCSATHNDYLGFCDRLDQRVPIIHLHLHENWGDADSHLTVFTGPAAQDDSGIRGLLARLRQRNFSGSVILEQWPQPASLLKDARDRLLQLWKSSRDRPDAKAALKVIPQFGRARSPNGPFSGRLGPAASEAPPTTEPVPPKPFAPKRQEVPGSHGLAAELAAGDSHHRSWREKLDFVRGLLARNKPVLTVDGLIDIAVYLRFLGTGELACAEDGRHFRPAHHARISTQIHERLVQLATPENAFVVRRIYPWLPSSAPSFRRPEPLTRIRDIAHRNDIASDLKREIKTTLQNKLHRCAGPEDLATSSALLRRITAPGANFPPAFVQEFRIFHEELKEFFNAQSLEQRLRALMSSVEGELAGQIRLFLDQKAGRTLHEQLEALRTLTALRKAALAMTEKKPILETQELLLADIALEDFAFVLSSEIINGCEGEGAPGAVDSETEALVLALNNLELSGIDRVECRALQSELRAWGKPSVAAGRDQFFRLRATLLRCRRLAEDFTERIVALFSARVEKLGRELGLAEHVIRIFSESEVRGHLVFQVSKLVSALLRWTCRQLDLPPWDVVVGGRAAGQVRTLGSLDEFERAQSFPSLLLLKSAGGDEEVPPGVAGIILAHELPHLSHLAVRARQAGILLVACEEPAEFERARNLEGQTISLVALPEKVSFEKALDVNSREAVDARPAPQIPAMRLPPERPWITLEQCVPENAGGKATGARRLAELARQNGAEFTTPFGFAVPFGVMEQALAAAPAVNGEYRRLADKLNGMPPGEFAATTRRLRELVQSIQVPDAILSGVKRRFAPDVRLVVRSSANCEDLEELAGAGLYDSVLNVRLQDMASAIRTVWSSLWTERAALSRRDSGIPHDQAHMAVLVQELVVPEFSFILHTANPISGNVAEVYAEIVVGLGDTLASASSRGSPYRLVCHKRSGVVEILASANFSQASWPNSAGGLRRETVDYSRISLSYDAGALAELARRLASIGAFVEQALGKPQDIEGAVVNGRFYLVQARPQPGLPSGKQL